MFLWNNKDAKKSANNSHSNNNSRDKEEKAAHSSITKWLKDLTGSSNQSYDIGPHILFDDLNENKGKFRAKSESFKKNKFLENVTFRDSDVTLTDDIYENVESVSKRNRRKFESFKEIKSKNPTLDENIYENIHDKRKFKRHSFSGTRKDRHRKHELQDSVIIAFDEELSQRIRSGRKKKERHKSTAESVVKKTKDSGDCERDNYANHVSEYEVYANVSTALRLQENTNVENVYEVIDAIHVPRDKPRKVLHEQQKHDIGSDFCETSVVERGYKSRRDQSCKRYEKNPNGGGSVKILSRHSVLYHSQNRGNKTSKRSRQATTLRRHSFNLIVPEIGAVAESTQIRRRDEKAMTGGYLSSSSVRQIDNSSPPPTPVRDASSLKSIRYGPGHEKFPSWPEVALARSGPVGGGSFRSKSWTDQTHYSKETPAPPTRPYMKRPNPAFTQQLKTVMERCEKIPPSTFESRPLPHFPGDRRDSSSKGLYLPHLDREGKYLGDDDYSVPSPPERDIPSGSLTQAPLTQADLEKYTRTYGSDSVQGDYEDYVSCYESESGGSRVYDDPQIGSLTHNHQTQGSYAQSEGYHSYVSSADSTTTTPFLDRLRRDNDCSVLSSMEETSVRRETSRDSSASSGSSSETLKWRGSMSDVSVSSSSRGSSSQLIAHSARVETPQRHLSESVLYLESTSSASSQRHSTGSRHAAQHQLRRLASVPVSTYTVAPQVAPSLNSPTSPKSPPMTVADRISELEKSQLPPPSSKHPAPSGESPNDKSSLKAIQKKALLSFYERHHSAWRSEPQLTPAVSTAAIASGQTMTSQNIHNHYMTSSGRPAGGSASRRSSSASDYAGGGHWKEMFGSSKDVQHDVNSSTGLTRDRGHNHSSSCGSLSTAVLGPIIMGPAISIDDWVPERPPKKPHLRSSYAQSAPRAPSPELPPPSPPPAPEDEVYHVFDPDEPLPPPPPEVAWSGGPTHERLKANSNANASSNRSPDDGNKPATLPPPRLPDRQFDTSHRQDVLKLRHMNEKSSPERERGRISLPNENRAPHHHFPSRDEKLIQERKSFPTHSYLPEIESKSLDYIEPRTKRLSPPARSTNKPGPQVPVERKNSLKARNQNISQNSLNSSGGGHHNSPSKENSLELTNKINEIRSSYKSAKENFTRSSSVRNSEMKIARGSGAGAFAHHQPDRQSLRFPSGGPPVNGVKPASAYVSAKVFNQSMSLVPKSSTDVARSLKTASGLPPSLPAQCPPTQHQMSQSKASYLAYRREPREREKGLPNFEGSYKRTMSPSGRVKSPLVENNQVPATVPPTITSIPSPPCAAEPPSSPPITTSPPPPPRAPSPPPPPPPSQSECPRAPHISLEAAEPSPQSKTLPRNYVREPHQQLTEKQRISRTPRTQSDPLNMPGRLAALSSAVHTHQSQHLSLALVKRERIPRSRSDISNAGSNESGYSSSSLNVSSPASSPTRTPVDLSDTSEPTGEFLNYKKRIEPSEPSGECTNHRTHQCVETQCNLGSRPPAQCTSQSHKPVHRPAPLSRLHPSSVNHASSQTDLTSSHLDHAPSSLDSAPSPPPDPASPMSRQREEELECDKLSRDLASVLPPNDRLHGLLIPGPDVKKRRDYVTSLFRIDVTPRSKSSSSSSHSSDPASPKETKNGMSERSAYFAPSECKAKLLALASSQARQAELSHQSSSNSHSLSNLHEKKAELMSRLDSKLTLLRSMQEDLADETRGNEALGHSLDSRLAAQARPTEAAKYRLHVEEVGHITSLLLGLSGRLARAENALIGLSEDHCDRKSLEEKRDKLARQLDEAKELKENIDRRSTNVATLLRKYLSSDDFADYNHFISMKAKLLVDAREISDKIQLGEEQLAALQETLDT